MEVSIPQEILFAIGILLFAASLVLVGVILRSLLQVIQQSSSFLWVLPLAATLFVLIFGLLHFHTTITYLPKLTPRDTELVKNYFNFEFYGSIAFFASSLLALFASLGYYWKTSH